MVSIIVRCSQRGSWLYYFLTILLISEQKAAEKQNKLAEIMEKQACTVSAMKPAQATSDGDMKKLLVAQYGHESDEEL